MLNVGQEHLASFLDQELSMTMELNFVKLFSTILVLFWTAQPCPKSNNF